MRRSPLSLALAGLLLLGAGFDWASETDRLARELRTANVARRREIVRLLSGHEGEAAHAALVSALSDENDVVRREAMDACARAGFPEAWPALAALLVEGNAETRASAARGLGRSGDRTFVPALVRALGDAEAVVRTAALSALAGLGDEGARGAIEARLDDDDPRARAAAAAALGELASPLSVSALVARVADEAPEVRLAVVRALGALGEPSAVPSLEAAFEDAHEPVRVAAALALAHLPHPRTVAILKRQLGSTTTVARTAAAGLAVLSTDEALDALVGAALDPATKLVARSAVVTATRRDPDAAHRICVRLAAALSDARGPRDAEEAIATLALVLAERPDDVVTEALVRALERERLPSPTLLEALGRSGGEAALVPLLARATGEDDRVRGPAFDAIVRLLEIRGADGRIADPLIEALGRATTPEGTSAIARALGYAGAERAVPALVELTASESSLVRATALEALGRAGAVAGVAPMLAALAEGDVEARRAARAALGRCLDADTLDAALTRVAAPAPLDRVSVLEAIAEAIPRLVDTDALPPARRLTLLARLDALAASPRDEIAALAIEIVARLDVPGARDRLVALAAAPGPARVEAVLTLASGDDARFVDALRASLGDDDALVRAAAAIGLGERGVRDDLARLVAAGARGPWNVTLATSFALARLARRGALVAQDADALCGLGLARDPVVHANLLVARAALGASACAGAPPARPGSEAFVRAAWIRASRARGADVGEACVTPVEPIVRAACEDEAVWPALDARVSITAFDADERTVLPSRFVAIALGDGTVLPVRTSRAARVALGGMPRGPMMLFDPLRTSLER